MTLAKNHLIALLLLLTACSYLPEEDTDMTDVIVKENLDYIEIQPIRGAKSATGLIFYPGGLVDPHAYVGLASRFAQSGVGHRVIIVKMPANLAILGSKSADKILGKEEDLQWVIAGHSLGGVMACSMVEAEPTLFEGLVLMASYSASSNDLVDWEGAVLSIAASEDQVMDWGSYEESKKRLPSTSKFMVIQGGNHGGFGSYGNQKGDGEAIISLEAQQQLIVEYLQEFYENNALE